MIPKTLTNALCGATLLASTATAQNLPEPTIDAETLGFSIGMSADEVLSRIQSEFSNVRPRITEARHPESRQEFIYSVYLVAGEERITFFFTGHFSGNRLYSLTREARFPDGQRPSAYETRQQLLSKYGLPTRAGGNTLFYNFDADDVISFGTNDEVRPLVETDNWESYGFSDLARAMGKDATWRREQSRCHENIETVQNGRAYTPLNPNPPMSENCMAAMKIETPAVDGLLATLKVHIGDFRFVAESALIDQANDVRPVQEPSSDPAKL